MKKETVEHFTVSLLSVFIKHEDELVSILNEDHKITEEDFKGALRRDLDAWEGTVEEAVGEEHVDELICAVKGELLKMMQKMQTN